ncbi:hypothetical protein BX616_005281 [Lobosporangium transversale]|nr:hypothetical protein BX616_005281 [Lobosporangium transversale]
MLGLVSTSTTTNPTDLLKAVLPIGIGLASAAFLAHRATNKGGFSRDKSIPIVPLRAGDKSHDAEYAEDQNKFLSKCVENYGLVFNVMLWNQKFTVVSGSLIREVFMNEQFSFIDALEEVTGMKAFTDSITKTSNDENWISHSAIRDNLSPFLPLYTPRIVEQLTLTIDRELGDCKDGKLIEKPINVFQEMVAAAMATVFMGNDCAKDHRVRDSFIKCTYDFGEVLGRDNRLRFWHRFNTQAKYSVLNPLKKHIDILVEVATPVILKRRQEEAEANAKGEEYVRPLDMMQKLLDNFDKYGFVDIEDVCGHLLLLVLASVHTTSDSAANLCYYFAAFPEHVDVLYQEQCEALSQIEQERQTLRQSKLASGEVKSEQDFVGSDLDPKNDRDLSAAMMKRLVKMDSFVREVLRYRTERLTLAHTAREDITLSNGMRITKGSKAIINNHSVHQSDEVQGGDAYEFRPWRFVGKAKAATKAGNDFLVFGMGK